MIWENFSDIYTKAKLMRVQVSESKEPLNLKEVVGVKQGNRDNSMLRLADSLLAKGYEEADVWQIMNELNQTYNPPLDEKSMQRLHKQAVTFISSRNTYTKNESFDHEKPHLNQDLSPDQKMPYPQQLAQEAYYGIAGEIVRIIEPHTESDPVALLINFITAFGSVIGDAPHCVIESREHPCRIFACIVGKSSKARKGTSWGQIERLFTLIDPQWKSQGGLSSGEGLIWTVRDPIEKTNKKGEIEVVDAGIDDKRLQLVEPEFSSVLQVMAREKNTLSSILRKAWEDGNLQTMTKNSPAKATGAHISILAHITEDELVKLLTDIDTINGFANRFLWFCVKRSKYLPRGGGDFDIAQQQPLLTKIISTVTFAKNSGRIEPTQETWELWDYIYPILSSEQHGIFGAMVGRIEAYARRLSTIYALLDESSVVKPEHLMAALAILDYVEESIRYIFQDRTGDQIANKILVELKDSPDGLTLTAINDLFGRHQNTERLTLALDYLINLGRIKKTTIPSSGRNITVFSLNSQFSTKKTGNYLNNVKNYAEENGIKYCEKSEKSPNIVIENNERKDFTKDAIEKKTFLAQEAINKLIAYGVLKQGQTTCQNPFKTTAKEVWVDDGNGNHHWVKAENVKCNGFLFWQVGNDLPQCSMCNSWYGKYEEAEIKTWYQTKERDIQELQPHLLTYAERGGETL